MKGPLACEKISGSFRDPDGFLFTVDGVLYRQVNASCREDYGMLMASGLYEDLTAAGLMVPHEEAGIEGADPAACYKVLRPETIPFISYPYEWCFSQLKNAALAVLEIQKRALSFGMSLKDASAYNMQFRNNRPVLIDTLSFEKYDECAPWAAYGQFCRHFLAPLALAAYKDIRLNQLLRAYIDGIPLDLAGSLLPASTKFKPSLMVHIHIHAGYQARFAKSTVDTKGRSISRHAFLALVESLRSAVENLQWRPASGGWSGYYEDNAYSAEALREKERIVSAFLDKAGAGIVWDLGANTGRFSRIAAAKGRDTVSFDSDAACVEKSYLECLKEENAKMLPLVMDLTNPSAGAGWENSERASFMQRGPAATTLALALVHHLAIANNLPLQRIAEFFSRICGSLIIEFVPKDDPQAKRLLACREDIFPHYSREGFEAAFAGYFTTLETAPIKGTGRAIYLMSKINGSHG